MIVVCDRCSTKYRVREDKFPKDGGNIKCPECAHVFFVKPVEEQAAAHGLRKATVAPSSSMDAATRVGTVPSMLLSGTGAHPRISSSSNAPVRKAPLSAQEPPSAAPEAPSFDDPDEDLEGVSWKLKTSFGLIYDFPDTESLRNWLSGRDDLTGYQLSKDGQNFHGLETFSGITADASASGRRSAPAASGGLMSSGNKPPPPSPSRPIRSSGPMDPPVKPGTGKIKEQKSPTPRPTPSTPKPEAPAKPRFRPVSDTAAEYDDDDEGGNIWIGVAAVGLIAVFAIVGLQLGGVVDFKKMIPQPEAPNAKKGLQMHKANTATKESDPFGPGNGGGAQPDQPTQPTPRVNANNTKPNNVAPSPFGHNDHVKGLLNQARLELRKRKYDAALNTLASAQGISPNNPEVYKLLETAYRRKGLRKEAKEAREQYQRLSKKRAARP